MCLGPRWVGGVFWCHWILCAAWYAEPPDPVFRVSSDCSRALASIQHATGPTPASPSRVPGARANPRGCIQSAGHPRRLGALPLFKPSTAPSSQAERAAAALAAVRPGAGQSAARLSAGRAPSERAHSTLGTRHGVRLGLPGSWCCQVTSLCRPANVVPPRTTTTTGPDCKARVESDHHPVLGRCSQPVSPVPPARSAARLPRS